ncbi:SMP-30/gluconolactonase/LRE family protein [Nocardia sp. NPDC057663]|uniref:SMP-30/gluconolactonase/LRE family protein n=1 Tax=Nocardia sp. NPDC057663 TaxID=3346201 RepID=UPI00366AC149
MADGFTFPESPRWHAGRNAFYHVDVDEGEVWERKDEAGRLLHRFDGFISGLVFDDADGFFVSSLADRTVQHLKHAIDGDPVVSTFADVSAYFANGINDMTRGPRGDLYLGGFNFDALARFKNPDIPLADGTFVQIGPDGTVAPASGAVTFPNGIIIDPTQDRVLMADTYRQRISSWPILADGTLGEQGVWADLGDGRPDGMCLDAEGAIWYATDNRVVRVREGGQVTDTVEFADGRVTACMLGGTDGRTLLVTAAASINRDVLHASRTGVLYEVHVDVPGAGLPSVY